MARNERWVGLVALLACGACSGPAFQSAEEYTEADAGAVFDIRQEGDPPVERVVGPSRLDGGSSAGLETEPDQIEPEQMEPDSVATEQTAEVAGVEPDPVQPDPVEPDSVEPDDADPVDVDSGSIESDAESEQDAGAWTCPPETPQEICDSIEPEPEPMQESPRQPPECAVWAMLRCCDERGGSAIDCKPGVECVCAGTGVSMTVATSECSFELPATFKCEEWVR